MQPRPRFRASEYRESGKLKGRKTLITGGDSGIGRAVAVLFAREGAQVAIVHLPREAEDGKETAAAVKEAGGRCVRLVGDVRDPEFCGKVVEETVRRLGGLDILVNNAALRQHQDDLTAISPGTFQANIHAYFNMARAALPHLKAGAALLNTRSISGIEGSDVLIDYSATKGAIHTLTKSLARNLVHREFRVNHSAPGPVRTPLTLADKPAAETARFGSRVPMGRPVQPEEIAPAFVFFASAADSPYITSEVLTLLGGDTVAA